jgi:hypothetical protein
MRPITIRGTTYPSASAAARALGVSKQAVSSAQDLDLVGLGRSAPRTITLEGVTYRSLQHASRETGIPFSTLQRKHRRDNPAS